MKRIEGVEKVLVVGGGLTNGKHSVLEARLLGADDNYIRTKYLSCADLKEKGIIKRYDSFKKAEKWLNTKEGPEWVSTAIHCQIF